MTKQVRPTAAAVADKDGLNVIVANAPCSYGAFELTVDNGYPNIPGPRELLDAVARAEYAGIDLGPLGYLGKGNELAERLASRSLGLAGGYLELPYSQPDELATEMWRLDALLDLFDLLPAQPIDPRPTLADAGSPARSALPGRSAIDHSVGLSERGWRLFADGLARVVERSRERGYEPTFHHHTATYIEAQWEIERMLELTDVAICLDTGHLLLGRGDPVQAIRDWGSRINHFHLKDAKTEILEAIVRDAAPVEEIWRRRAFVTLGEGDVDVDGVLQELSRTDYAGWLVIEQDIIPRADEPLEAAERAQRANREYLRSRGV